MEGTAELEAGEVAALLPADALLRASAALLVATGRARAVVVPGRGGVFAQGGEGCWTLALPLGEPDEAALRAAAARLAAGARLLVWEDEAMPGLTAVLAPLGARRWERWTFVQDLARVPPPEPADDAVVLAPWDGDPALVARMAGEVALTLAGLFLTCPQPPTVERCHEAWARALADPARPLLPEASFVARRDGRTLGAVVAVAGEAPDEGLLWDLWVAPDARGSGLGRRLVRALQSALLASGRRRHRFLALGANDPVMRLFRPEELIERTCRTGGQLVPGV